jgi:dipeptidyl aminopeptidase/acylaminoacyl peptidase
VDELLLQRFPVAGILVVYEWSAQFFPLKGADDRRYVQSNPVWSPDGKTILFARSESYSLAGLKDPSSAVVEKDEVAEFFEGGRKFRYDIYRIDFNDGRGGDPTPLPGASDNGTSNYFPRHSPDGKWIVFCGAAPHVGGPTTSTPARRRGTPEDAVHFRPDELLHSWSPTAGGLRLEGKRALHPALADAHRRPGQR